MKRAFLFPGQGTQRVGMGQRFHHLYPEVEATFDEAQELLGFDLRDVCFRGPAAELTATQNAQPAIFTCSVGALRVLRARGVGATAAAGHSVGEFAALHAAGAITFADALLAVRHRAELMAATHVPGTMAAIIGLGPEEIDEVCRQAGSADEIAVALHNGPRYYVVSGAVPAVDKARELADQAGALKVIPLAVSHAFHSPLMSAIVEQWSSFVSTLPLGEPTMPVPLNTLGRPAADETELRRAIVDQVTERVRWVDCVEDLVRLGVTDAVEVADSKVLVSLNRNIERSLRNVTLGDPVSVERLAKVASTEEPDPTETASLHRAL